MLALHTRASPTPERSTHARRMHDALAPYIKDADRDGLVRSLDELEDWLYGDGEDVPKSVGGCGEEGWKYLVGHQTGACPDALPYPLTRVRLWYAFGATGLGKWASA
eukprot:111380-Chlamydomonas_euryale.AAC.1